jgi:hypothetical protein
MWGRRYEAAVLGRLVAGRHRSSVEVWAWLPEVELN